VSQSVSQLSVGKDNLTLGERVARLLAVGCLEIFTKQLKIILVSYYSLHSTSPSPSGMHVFSDERKTWKTRQL